MRLLAIDTALECCSVGVSVGDGADPVLKSEAVGRGHAERLFAMIEAAIDEAGLGFDQLDRIAVTIGPGTFTGLRIGIAAARGLALVTNAEAVGIGTLAVHAESARASAGARSVLALLDARRGEAYGQAFDGEGKAIGEPRAARAESFAEHLDDDMLLAGSGAEAVAAAAGGDTVTRIVHRRSAPEIGALLRLGLSAPAPREAPRPLYLRPPDAKPQAAAGVSRQ